MYLPESHPLIRAKRRVGRIRRYLKRKWWERNIGKEYREWLANSMQVEAGSVDNEIPIAVIVPVFNPPPNFLSECLASVVKQSARNWQLLVSDDGSTDRKVVELLDQFTKEHADDPRVVVIRGSNEGISAAQNYGLEQVTCEYFGWLDHDDQLNPRAIELVSRAISEIDGRPQVVYSDEDKIDSKGQHFELYCKPDFSPELLLSQMYLCHFTVFETELVRSHGGFRSEMDGAQDFDLALRLLPHLENVRHVPHPLYHWRAWSGSTALTIDAKPWAQTATARAQQEHLDRHGGGSVEPSSVPGLNSVHPDVHGSPLVSVIIPTIGTTPTSGATRFVDTAIKSLRNAEQQCRLEIVVVTTGELAAIPGADAQIVYQPSNGFNFAEAVNLGRAHAAGDYLLLLNDDTTAVTPDPVFRLLELGQIPGVGAVGAKLTYPDGRLQHSGIVLLPSGPTHVNIGKPGAYAGYFGSTFTPRNYSAVTAAAMLTTTAAFDAVRGFDTAFARDFNDVDYCLRLGAIGYRVAWTPYAHLTHHEGASIVRKVADRVELGEFQARWSDVCSVDPYYSPALNPSLERIFEAL
ncbi:glycosyltransferase [Candidatus Nanopelagicales bacterium]|nr:glycosyltransferase [Candidatus Nanopelagicales bacterium]